MKRLIIYLTILLLITVSGCMVGPDFQKPVVNTPAKFNYEMVKTDTVLNLRWWVLFNDPQLVSLIDTGLKNNQDVLIAASRIEEARLVVGYTRADLGPSIGYTGNASRTNIDLFGNSGSTFNNFSTLGNINWEIDFWGKYRRATESAKADMLASQYAQRTVQVSLISEIANTYFLLLDFNARLEISKQTLNSRQEGLRIMNSKFEYGTIPEIDLNQAEIQEAIAASAVPAFVRAVAQTEHALSVLLGQNPGPVESGRLRDEKAPEIPAGIPSGLLERRPDVMQAELLLAAQNARIGVAQAMRFPSISLTGALGMASSDLSTLLSSPAWSLGSGITGPIFNFGKNRRRVEIEKQKTQQAFLNYEKVVLQSFREVEDALVEIQTLEQELQAVLKQKKAAENAALLSRERYREGVTSYLEVLDSDRSNFNVDLAAAETYQKFLNAHVKLYKALGGGWISAAEENGQ